MTYLEVVVSDKFVTQINPFSDADAKHVSLLLNTTECMGASPACLLLTASTFLSLTFNIPICPFEHPNPIIYESDEKQTSVTVTPYENSKFEFHFTSSQTTNCFKKAPVSTLLKITLF